METVFRCVECGRLHWMVVVSPGDLDLAWDSDAVSTAEDLEAEVPVSAPCRKCGGDLAPLDVPAAVHALLRSWADQDIAVREETIGQDHLIAVGPAASRIAVYRVVTAGSRQQAFLAMQDHLQLEPPVPDKPTTDEAVFTAGGWTLQWGVPIAANTPCLLWAWRGSEMLGPEHGSPSECLAAMSALI